MLSKPLYGWTDITVGNFIGRGSHIQDIPILFLEAFLRALAHNIPAEIEVDEEGSTFIMQSYHSTTITAFRNEQETFFIDADATALAAELLNDLRNNWNDWLEWPAEIRLSSEKEKPALLKSRNIQLTRLSRELEKYL